MNGEYKMDKEENAPSVDDNTVYEPEFSSYLIRDWIQVANDLTECESISIRIKQRMRLRIENEIEKLLDR